MRAFSKSEVASHNIPEDCWLIIDDKVYDVTAWVPKHPGGALIYINAGHDCTQLFESYHPLRVRKLLGSFCIGALDAAGEPSASASSPPALLYLPEGGEDDGFYAAVKRRVEAHFATCGANPRAHPLMHAKALAILAAYALCYYGAFFGARDFWAALGFALAMGVCAGEVGVSIQHDCNHGAFSENRWLTYVLGVTLDLVGASSFMWKQQHVVGHHLATNVDHFDPDIRVKDPDVRTVAPTQPRQWYHAYQHVYLAALYGLLALKSVLLDDFSAYFSGEIGPLKLAPMTTPELAVFVGGKALYALYMLVLPTAYGVHGPASFALLFFASQLVTGWMLALLFQVAHVQAEAEWPRPERSGGVARVRRGWAAAQVATTTNFSPGSIFWTHFSGGLNHQIEHHLFPGVCHVYYPAIQPIVEATCKEFGVPYHAYPTFWAALSAHFKYLQAAGVGAFSLRLDG